MTDIRTRTLTMYQFQDNEQLCLLESLLVQVAPSKCHNHAMTGALRQGRMEVLFDTLQISPSEHKAKAFESIATETAVRELKQLVGEDELVPFLLRLESTDWELALRAASCLAKEEGLLRMDAGSFELVLESLDQFMRLDSAAISALNLLPNIREVIFFLSLFLRFCCTHSP